MTITRFVTCSSILVMTIPAGSAREKEGAFQGVQQSVQERSGKTVRWEEDQAAHEQALQEVRQLLRKPLTVDTAVQIALSNNRSLQATFEEIGLSTADLIDAATFPNPRFDLAIRFPDKPPSGTYIDYGAAIDFLSIIMIPLKKRVAKRQLEAAALRVADATLELISQVRSAFYSLQASQELLTRFKLIVDTNAASLDLAQRQHEAGNITDLALARLQASYSRSRLDGAESCGTSSRAKGTSLVSIKMSFCPASVESSTKVSFNITQWRLRILSSLAQKPKKRVPSANTSMPSEITGLHERNSNELWAVI